MTEDKHVLSILVDNQPGVLSRIAGLFSGRGYNIESLCVAPTIDPLVSRITLVTKANLPAIDLHNRRYLAHRAGAEGLVGAIGLGL